MSKFPWEEWQRNIDSAFYEKNPKADYQVPVAMGDAVLELADQLDEIAQKKLDGMNSERDERHTVRAVAWLKDAGYSDDDMAELMLKYDPVCDSCAERLSVNLYDRNQPAHHKCTVCKQFGRMRCALDTTAEIRNRQEKAAS